MKKFQKQYPKDLEEAEKQLYYENGRTNKPLNSIPCLICDGLGWFYDPSEKPCSVEGYKMVTRIKCKDCNEKGYTINELAKDVQIPAYLLTQYINRKLETNFSDLINQERIEECCQLMESGEYKHLTLEGLADKCGFNNRNSFSVAFKKFKGVTPSQFQKDQGLLQK